MGLDMYLEKRIFIGANYGHSKIKGKIEITKGEDNTPIKIDLSKVAYIIERVAYWRKANAIHQWFVDNVQEGEDDCKEYYVDKEKIKELVDLCKEVVERAKVENGIITNGKEIEDLLPTQEGFFFGLANYDQWYLEDVKNTIEQLEPLLDVVDGDFYYQSSW